MQYSINSHVQKREGKPFPYKVVRYIQDSALKTVGYRIRHYKNIQAAQDHRLYAAEQNMNVQSNIAVFYKTAAFKAGGVSCAVYPRQHIK